MGQNTGKNNSDWKWGASFEQAAKLISDVFGVSPDAIKGHKDDTAKTLIQAADTSDVDVKRTRDVAAAYRKLWNNTTKINGIVHGLIRHGLDLTYRQRKEDSKTAKHLANFTANTQVLDARTTKGAEIAYHRRGAAVEAIASETEQQKEVITQRYSSLSEYNQQRQQQSLADIQARTQKRIEGSKKPWKN